MGLVGENTVQTRKGKANRRDIDEKSNPVCNCILLLTFPRLRTGGVDSNMLVSGGGNRKAGPGPSKARAGCREMTGRVWTARARGVEGL